MDTRTLSLPISTLDYKQPTTVQVGSPVSVVIDMMQDRGTGCVLVVDEDEQLVGIITERDLLQHLSGQRAAPAEFKVEQVMTADPEALRASDPIAFAVNLMHLGHFRHLPLCVWDDQGEAYPIGIISTRDILEHIAIFYRKSGIGGVTMLYDLAIDEELEQMDEDDALRAWNAQEIQVSLKDLMRPIIKIDINASTNEAIDLLLANQIGAAPVVENGYLRGIFSERDVLNKILNKQTGDLDDIGVEEFMIADPQTAQPEDTLNTAILHMAGGGYRHVPIVDPENRPIGMVSIRDVISCLVEEFLQEVLTLPPKPVRDALKAREGA